MATPNQEFIDRLSTAIGDVIGRKIKSMDSGAFLDYALKQIASLKGDTPDVAKRRVASLESNIAKMRKNEGDGDVDVDVFVEPAKSEETSDAKPAADAKPSPEIEALDRLTTELKALREQDKSDGKGKEKADDDDDENKNPFKGKEKSDDDDGKAADGADDEKKKSEDGKEDTEKRDPTSVDDPRAGAFFPSDFNEDRHAARRLKKSRNDLTDDDRLPWGKDQYAAE